MDTTINVQGLLRSDCRKPFQQMQRGTGPAVFIGETAVITSFQRLDVSLADVSLPADL